MATCGARNKTPPHNLCRRRVKEAGVRCYQHSGLPAGGPRPAPKRRKGPEVLLPAGHRPSPKGRDAGPDLSSTPSELSPEQQERVEECAAFCLDLVNDGWANTVADRAKGILTRSSWDRLFGERRAMDCKALAELARALLAVKEKFDERVGEAVDQALARAGSGRVERAIARELVKRIPNPVNDQMVVMARGLQMLGIAVCVLADRPLSHCQSFIDLSLHESKERLKKLMAEALQEWEPDVTASSQISTFPR